MADISKIKLPNDNTIYDIRDKATHVELTQAAYEALEQAGEVIPNKVYFIKDANGNVVAQYVRYSNTTSRLSATNVQAAIDELSSEKADRVPEPAEYDSTATYSVGDFVTYNDNIYICTTTISTAEAWDSSHWQLITPDTDYLHSINPVGNGSFSLNRSPSSTVGIRSFAEGHNTIASGADSHAEGTASTASGTGAHAEGTTSASGYYSHSEGFGTTASGGSSHAEGGFTVASGNYSHAEGYATTANHKSQHTFGEYNIVDTSSKGIMSRGNYVEIVGNGTATDARSNARTLDWSGNEVLAGGLKLNGNLNVSPTVEVTQAEYDQLKLDGDLVEGVHYVITDGQDVTCNLGDLNDVDTSGASTGDLLALNGSTWESTGVSTDTITPSVTGPAIKISKYGKMRQLWVNTQTYSNSGDVQIGTLPNDSKPINMVRYYFSDKSHYIAIETDGKIISANGESYVVANITYMVS